MDIDNQPLHIRQRPTEFGKVLGNTNSVTVLQTELDKDNGGRAFCIYGKSGTGKTTLARISAEYVGGDKLSIVELNTADNRGIDTARDIIEDTRYASMGGTRVYIIDEAHGITGDAKRALLKVVEDQPEDTYFFFLTTDIERLYRQDEGEALKRRLIPIKVIPLKSKMIEVYLNRILKQEQIEVPEDITITISKNCNGSLGLALMYLESVKDLEEKDMFLRLEDLFLTDDEDIILFCRALYNKQMSWSKLTNMLKQLKEEKTAEEVRRIIMGYGQTILLRSEIPDATVTYKLECFCEIAWYTGFPGITLATAQAYFEGNK